MIDPAALRRLLTLAEQALAAKELDTIEASLKAEDDLHAACSPDTIAALARQALASRALVERAARAGYNEARTNGSPILLHGHQITAIAARIMAEAEA